MVTDHNVYYPAALFIGQRGESHLQNVWPSMIGH